MIASMGGIRAPISDTEIRPAVSGSFFYRAPLRNMRNFMSKTMTVSFR